MMSGRYLNRLQTNKPISPILLVYIIGLLVYIKCLYYWFIGLYHWFIGFVV